MGCGTTQMAPRGDTRHEDFFVPLDVSSYGVRVIPTNGQYRELK